MRWSMVFAIMVDAFSGKCAANASLGRGPQKGKVMHTVLICIFVVNVVIAVVNKNLSAAMGWACATMWLGLYMYSAQHRVQSDASPKQS